MLQRLIGTDKFFEGVSIYLKAHLYGTATGEDLWKGVSEAAGFDVAPMMRTWVNKVGFPFVEVKETKEGLSLKQSRFLAGARPTKEEDETVWSIPLNLKTLVFGRAVTDSSLLMDARELRVSSTGVWQPLLRLATNRPPLPFAARSARRRQA